MISLPRLRLPLATLAATAVALAVAGPASAHVHTDPSSIEAGAEATVGFTIEHGCEASPTTKMEIQLPKGSAGVSGVDGNGFTATTDGLVVTFVGGSVADGTEATFEVAFTAPAEPGDVPVKIIQTCAEGVNEWIQVQADGEPEPESPAPVLTITEGAPTGGDTEHGHDEATTTTSEHGHDEEASTTVADAEHGHDEEVTTTVAVSTTGADDDGDDDSSSSAPLVIGGIAALVVIGGGGALYARSRKQDAEA